MSMEILTQKAFLDAIRGGRTDFSEVFFPEGVDFWYVENSEPNSGRSYHLFEIDGDLDFSCAIFDGDAELGDIDCRQLVLRGCEVKGLLRLYRNQLGAIQAEGLACKRLAIRMGICPNIILDEARLADFFLVEEVGKLINLSVDRISYGSDCTVKLDDAAQAFVPTPVAA